MADDIQIMNCPYCKGRVSFEKKQAGEVVSCPICKTAAIRLRANAENGGKAICLVFLLGFLVLMTVGVWCGYHYFFNFPVNNAGEDIVNQDRLNIRLCGVIIGVGSCIAGFLSGVICFVMASVNRLDKLTSILTVGNKLE